MASPALLLLAALYFIIQHPCLQCTDIDMENMNATSNTPETAWVITRSSPCSATCGPGLLSQELCLLNSSTLYLSDCHPRLIQCMVSWQCGVQTRTVAVGQRVELDCLGELLSKLGNVPYTMSWRFARGIVTSDDRLFARSRFHDTEKVVLDEVKEKDAGTYMCEVQDDSRRRLKRIYSAVKVLSPQVMSLDFKEGLSQWDKPGGLEDDSGFGKGYVIASAVVLSLAVFISLSLCIIKCCRQPTNQPNNP